MAGGYNPPKGDSVDPIVATFKDQARQLRDVQRPSGTRLASLVAQVQAALANINTTVTNAINTLSYTRSVIDGKIASPGDITPGNVNASGAVTSAGALVSPGSKAATAISGYSNVYIDVNGMLAGNTSSRRYKQDITAVETDVAGFLGLTTYKFRYIAAVEEFGDDAAWEYGLIAEEVVKVAPWACFYEEDGVTVRGINYDRLVVALLNVVQDHEHRLTAAGL